ncbi:fucolectin-1-like [Ruditapes philippinarum]|uniref:fucolectin-1-like n=1 Tax=Ruditapes philippinarum TaxID=129788 RepID=UPI00295AE7D2|nr:fucolectin-1-like [Ruditapes philippinarum]
MSSIYKTYTSDKGVDGNVNQSFEADSCFHTGLDLNAWWQVDLTEIYRITKVVLYNRLFTENANRASDLDLLFGTTLDTIIIVKKVLGQINDIHSFTFTDDEKARYVKVMLQNQNFLHLCEVQVYGYDVLQPSR